MFERFTEDARRCLFVSRVVAAERGHESIEPEDLLRGTVIAARDRVRRFIGPSAFMVREPLESDRRPGETFEDLMQRLVEAKWFGSTAREIPFSTAVRRALQCCADEADALRHQAIRPEHLLLGLLREEDTEAWRALNEAGVSLQALRRVLRDEPDAFGDQGEP